MDSHYACSREATHIDLGDVRDSYASLLALLYAIVGGVFAWLLLPGTNFHLSRFLVFFLLAIEGIFSLTLSKRVPRITWAIVLIGPSISFALALNSFDYSFMPLFCIIPVLLNAKFGLLLNMFTALLNTLFLFQSNLVGPFFSACLILLWSAAIIEGIASHKANTYLQWAFEARETASQLVERLRDRQGQLNRTLSALNEATRRLETQGHNLAVARLRADAARGYKERFAANISHELRTPLNIILGFAEMMYLTPDIYGDIVWPSALRSDAYQMYQSSLHLLALINDVLDLSRIDCGQMPLQKESADLSGIIQESIELTQGLLKGSELTLSIQVPTDLPTLYVDRTRIRQVLINLVSNAIRFAERGSITVSARLEGEDVILCVADTGPGIPQEQLMSIFDEFHRVDMSLRRNKGGAGLGLAISKRFVELHGGRIWAESKEGVGSRFYFSLPVEGLGLRHLRQILPLSLDEEHYQPTLVVLDGDPAVGALLARRCAPYRIVQADNLTDTLDLAARVNPQAILLNSATYTEAGATFAAKVLAQTPPRTPVISCAIPSQSWVAAQTGARDCLIKPLTRTRLLERLHAYGDVQDILIVDDDRAFIQLVRRLLESAKEYYTVRWAYDGEQALARIQEARPDIILLDLVMPGMDGFGLLERLADDKTLHAIPVLLVTATDSTVHISPSGPSTLALSRCEPFGTSEWLSYVKAILDASLQEHLADVEPESLAAGPE